jgi:UDP-N-acetyl-D-galactosamine dehydrogenase
MLNRGEDPSREIGPEGFEGTDILFTANPEDLKQASFHIVAVPTPIDDSNMPDLSPLLVQPAPWPPISRKGLYCV